MLKYLDLFIGLLCVFYYFYLEIVYNGMSLDIFFIVVGSILILYHFVKFKIHLNKNFKKVFNIVLTIGLSIFLIAESMLIFFPKQNLKDNCDYLVILGASVKNTRPSLTLKGRLDKAIEYINKSNDDCYIVVSGGKGSDEKISEAKAMENYLIDHGISKSRIILEDKSTSTYENFKYSKEKIEKNSNKSIKKLNIKVVTTDFHGFRSFLLAKKNGYKNINFWTVNSINQFIPVYYLREFFALAKTVILNIL